MRKNKFRLLLAALSGVAAFIAVVLMADLPARITRGNDAQTAIQMLDSMRPPMLAIEKAEAGPSGHATPVTFEQFSTPLRDHIARYLDTSRYNSTLHERVKQFAQDVESWLTDEQALWEHRSSLDRATAGREQLQQLAQLHESAIKGFLQALDTLALGEQPIHHDIDRGRSATFILQVLAVVLILYLLTLIIIFQRSSQKELLTSYRQVREARRELAQREEYLSLTLDSIGDAVIATDTQGRVTRMNPVAEQLTGWSGADARSRPLKQVFHIVNAMTRELVPDPVEKVLQSGKIVGLANHTVLIARDHQEYQIADSGAPIRDEDDNIHGVILVFRDVTEEYRLQAAISTHRDELEQRVKDRTQELESFNYAVSHDLRAPLHSINGFSQILLDDYLPRLDEEGKDYLHRISDAARHMGELIDAMLTLSCVTRKDIRHTRVDLSNAARDIASKLQEQDSSRTVEWEIADHVQADGDADLLHIVLENLLGNAWKYSSKNKDKTRIEFGTTEQDGRQVFFVRDNGCGFNPDYADKLFGAFQRLHGQEYEGTGIGLATVQRIIERHQGRVWAESGTVSGATFCFTLG